MSKEPLASGLARDEAAQGMNAFTFELYRRAKMSRNFCLSPFSAGMALGLVHLGARGKTADALGAVLRLPPKESHAALGSLLARTSGGRAIEKHEREVPPHELSIANSVWVAKDYVLEQSYVARAQEFFASKVAEISFNDPPGAIETINNWIAKSTGNRIKSLVSDAAIKTVTRMIIANAVHLRAFWEHPFDERLTTAEAFHTESGTKVDVATMRGLAYLAYGEDESVQVLEMDYWPAAGAELAMVIVLPKRVDDLADVEARLDAERFAAWLGSMQAREVEIAIPRFRIESSLSLLEPLEGLGLGVLFERPDLSGISGEEGFRVDEFLQKVFIDVDEKGTEAAAATAIWLLGSAPPPPATFLADHPFFFAIRDKTSGAILFVGRVADPSAG